MGIIADIRDLIVATRRMMEGLGPCFHSWEKISEMRYPNEQGVRLILMCVKCGETSVKDFRIPVVSCLHTWEIHDTLEDWVQPMITVSGSRKILPRSRYMRSKTYVTVCVKCGDTSHYRVNVNGEKI